MQAHSTESILIRDILPEIVLHIRQRSERVSGHLPRFISCFESARVKKRASFESGLPQYSFGQPWNENTLGFRSVNYSVVMLNIELTFNVNVQYFQSHCYCLCYCFFRLY